MICYLWRQVPATFIVQLFCNLGFCCLEWYIIAYMHATIFVFDIFSVISKEVHTSHRKKIIAGNSVVSCDVFCDKSVVRTTLCILV